MRLLIAGGGTGGHIYPGIAVARAWTAAGRGKVLFVGTARGLEKDLVPREGFPLALIKVAPLRGRSPLALARVATTSTQGLVESWRVIQRFRPDVVLGTGGYVCGPVVLAAWLARRPLVLQEQNALPGKTNRVLANLADVVALGYSEAQGRFSPRVRGKLQVTGNPIRKELLAAADQSPAQARTALGLDPERQTVLIFGASQGAQRLNETVLALAPAWARGQVQFLHQTGQRNFAAVRERVRELAAQAEREGRGLPLTLGEEEVIWGRLHFRAYLYEMGIAYRAADLVVGRAGAISLAEITTLGLPALLIPYPYAAENHQEFNARALERQGAARVLLERELSAASLGGIIQDLLGDKAKLATMAARSRALGRPEATAAIVEILSRLGSRSRTCS